MTKRKIVVGSRDSKLAVWQTKLVMEAIEEANPHIELELVTMKTTGDIILDRTLDKIGGKGLFVKELDRALMDRKVDITVHSLKDMPMEVPEELPLLAFFKRGNPFDALVLPVDELKEEIVNNFENNKVLNNLEEVKTFISEAKIPVGTSSLRRRIQLKNFAENIQTKPVRGNVLTRLSKVDGGEFSSLILASAGLERLDLKHRISYEMPPQIMIPAAGQGILVVQGRANEDYDFLIPIDNKESRFEGEVERAFVTALDGGCSAPVAAYCKVDIENKTLKLYGFVGLEDMTRSEEGKLEINYNNMEEAREEARTFALSLKEKLENGK